MPWRIVVAQRLAAAVRRRDVLAALSAALVLGLGLGLANPQDVAAFCGSLSRAVPLPHL